MPATTRTRRTRISETASFSVKLNSVVRPGGFNLLILRDIRNWSAWWGQKVACGTENAVMKRV